MFRYCKYHDKRHIFASPHPNPAKAVTVANEALKNYHLRVKKPQGTAATPPPPKRVVHEHVYRHRDDSSFSDGVLVGAIAGNLFHDDPAHSAPSEPSWSGDGGSFSGGGASDSWASSDSSSGGSDYSSSDSGGSSFDSSSSSGGGGDF